MTEAKLIELDGDQVVLLPPERATVTPESALPFNVTAPAIEYVPWLTDVAVKLLLVRFELPTVIELPVGVKVYPANDGVMVYVPLVTPVME